jgi:hypothetical protein
MSRFAQVFSLSNAGSPKPVVSIGAGQAWAKSDPSRALQLPGAAAADQAQTGVKGKVISGLTTSDEKVFFAGLLETRTR